MRSIDLPVCDGHVQCPLRGDTDVERCYLCTHLAELTTSGETTVVRCRASRSHAMYRARDDLPLDSYPPF